MYKLDLKNATIKTILKKGKFTISRLEFKEGHEEHHTYDNRRRV